MQKIIVENKSIDSNLNENVLDTPIDFNKKDLSAKIDGDKSKKVSPKKNDSFIDDEVIDEVAAKNILSILKDLGFTQICGRI